MNTVVSTVRKLLATPHDARTAVFMIVFVALGRLLQEAALQGETLAAPELAALIPARLCFYTNLYFVILATLSVALPRRLPGLGNAASIGLLIGFLPPILDAFLSDVRPIRYEFMLRWEWHFYSEAHQPLGETITVWLGILTAGVFCGLVSRSVLRGLLAAAVCYLLMALMNVAISSWLHDFRGGVSNLRPWMINIPLIGMAWLIWHVLRWRSLVPRIRRMNHALPFIAICALGGAWTGKPLPELAVSCAMVALAFYTLLIHNDCYDHEEDAAAGRSAPTSSDDVVYSTLFLAAFLAGGAIFLLPASVIAVAAIIAIGFIYHHPAVRLKAIFCMSYKVEGAWAVLALAAGMAHATGFPDEPRVLIPTLLFFGGGALFSMPKDWKDIDSDRAHGIPTVYVRATEAGVEAAAVHARVCLALVAAILIPVLLLALHAGFHVTLLVPALAGLIAVGWLYGIRDRYRAVEGFYWLLGVWLLVLTWSVVVLG